MIQKRKVIQMIPGAEEWAGYARHAHGLWSGKSLEDMQPHFLGGLAIERGSELLFMPRRAFQFYAFAFAQYVMSEAAIGDSDGASSFLNYLSAREERDPGSVAQIYARLAPTIDFVGASQARFDASHDIYGDFAEKAEKLRKLCGTTLAQRDSEEQMLDPTDDA
jgi:hypothetical protein